MRFPRTCLLGKMSSFRRQWYTTLSPSLSSSVSEIWSSDDDSSFRSSFVLLFLLIVDTIQREKIPSGRAHTLMCTFILNIAFASSHRDPPRLHLFFSLSCSNISLSIPRMCNNVSSSSSHLFAILGRERSRVYSLTRYTYIRSISWKWMTILSI